MKTLSLLALRRLAAGVTTALAVGATGLAGLAPTAAAARVGGDDNAPFSSGAPLSISPSSGGPGTRVTVKANCRPSGPATSQAFQADIPLQQSGTQFVGTGNIKRDGLQVGRSYPVTVRCADGVTLSTTFTFTAGTPTGAAGAGFGGSGGAADDGVDGAKQATALAVGGGLAIAGTVGYVVLARRRRATGGQYY